MEDSAGIYALESAYLDRYVQLGIAGTRVLKVEFPQQPDEDARTEHELLDRINAYFEGEEDDFEDVEVALTVPTAQREVLETVRKIPYGEQASVEQVARMTAGLDPEDESDHALVRTALDENPTPLVIPDHRVRDGPSAAPPEVETRLRSLERL